MQVGGRFINEEEHPFGPLVAIAPEEGEHQKAKEPSESQTPFFDFKGVLTVLELERIINFIRITYQQFQVSS